MHVEIDDGHLPDTTVSSIVVAATATSLKTQ